VGSTPPITSATTTMPGWVVEDRAEVGGEDALRRGVRAFAARVADERLNDPKPVARGALDLAAALPQQPVDRRADRAVAEEGDGDVDR